MKVGIFSDIHGNSIALKQCLKVLVNDLSISDLYFLGDAVGYFTDANQVIDELRRCNCECVMGNHDAMLLGKIELNETSDLVYKITNTRQIISVENTSFLTQFKSSQESNINGKRVLFIHGSPSDNLTGYVYPDSDLAVFDNLDYDIVFMGHTHRPFVARRKNITFVNVGSVGLPRDCGNFQSFAVYDTLSNEVEVMRYPLDVNAIIEQYQDLIHPSVIDVLRRNHQSEINNLKIKI